MQTEPIYQLIAVGLGPGDPDLISVKGLSALQSADEIFYPASKLQANKIQSHSLQILNHYNLNAKLSPFHTPMTGIDRELFYMEAWKKIKASLTQSKKVAVVSEGDLLFYSTFGYILELAKKDQFKCKLIPGITAFANSASEAQIPIVEGNRPFKVIARPESFEEIEKELAKNQSLVIMKIKSLNGWFEFLNKTDRSFIYAEKTGTNEQFITSDIKELENHSIPYFSLIIFN